MAIYSSAANDTAGNLAGSPTVIHCVTPSATVGMSILEWYATCDETGAIGGRTSLIAATGGTATSTPTPEKFNSRSSAAGFATQTIFSVEPATSGNRLITLGYNADTVRILHRRWLTPNPRYPIYRDAGDGKLCINIENSAQVTFTRYFVIAEDKKSDFGKIRGRRNRTRGYFAIHDESRNFGGLSTSPKNCPGSNSYTAVQAADWASVPGNTMAFLNLLNAGGGGGFDPSTVPWNPTLPERFMAPWNPPRSETARAGWTQALWAVAPQKIPEPVLPERRWPSWNPEKSAWAGVNYLPPTWPAPTTLPERYVRPAWSPERTAWAGVNYLPPTWPTTVVQPERFMRPAWDAPKGQILWTPIVLVTPDWGYEMQGFNPLRVVWTPERSWLASVPYQPPRLPISVLGVDAFARRVWDPERSWSAGVTYLPPTWPSPTTLPERWARGQWDPERSALLGIPYLPPVWPMTVVGPERFGRPVWNPEKSETARAGWTQALWAVAPTRPPDGMFPERLLAPWRPQDQQVFWNPFQFALVTVPDWGYEVYGPQMLLRAAWNPPRTDIARAGWTQAQWAVAPDRPPDGVLPERLLSPWNPERSGHWWVPFQPIPDFGYEIYGPHSFVRGVWNPERTALQAIPYLPPTWPMPTTLPERFARPPWVPGRGEATFPIGPTSQVIVDPRNVAFTPQLLERFPFPDLSDRNFVLRPVQIITPAGRTIVYQIFVMDD